MKNKESWYIPIDYLRAEIIDIDPNIILYNSSLNFTERINTETGEIPIINKNGKLIKRRKKADYRGLTFQFYTQSKKMYLSGSIHKYKNNGEHNYDDFHYSKFNETLLKLEEEFCIKPRNIKLNQIEWGVNINPNYPIDKILKSILIHKGKRFEKTYVGRNSNYYQSVHTNFILKMYDKSIQYRTKKSILRFERKQRRYAQYCNNRAIGNTLQDLINIEFKGFREAFFYDLNQIIFFDPELNESMDYRDLQYWEQLRENTSRANVLKHRSKLKELNRKKGGNHFEKIIEFITEKIDTLNDQELTNFPFNYIGKTLTTSSRADTPAINLPIKTNKHSLISIHYGIG
ncbi:hypothetical protein N9I21_01560 [Crocinitomicaceae bacterium]|nr:hypothetical protein [Crocinitomicaceae bacterium]